MPYTATVAQGVVVGRTDWAGRLTANKQAFVDAWVQRAEFRAAYDGLTNNAYVDKLTGNAGAGFNGDRNALINGLTSGSLTRSAVLRQVVENEGFTRAKRNEMFVMMEYFGYLRRDPDQAGYAFWLNKLNQFDGNFEQAVNTGSAFPGRTAVVADSGSPAPATARRPKKRLFGNYLVKSRDRY
jgi:hypothetical protein